MTSGIMRMSVFVKYVILSHSCHIYMLKDTFTLKNSLYIRESAYQRAPSPIIISTNSVSARYDNFRVILNE